LSVLKPPTQETILEDRTILMSKVLIVLGEDDGIGGVCLDEIPE